MVVEFITLFSVVGLFLAHCMVNGTVIQGLLKCWDFNEAALSNVYIKSFFAGSLGLMLNIAVLFILGVCGFLSIGIVLTVAVLMLAAGVIFLIKYSPDAVSFWAELRFFEWGIFAVLLMIFLFSVMHAPGHWDDTMYQLPLSRTYIQHQGFFVNEFLRFPLFPQNINLVITLGLMFGDDMMAQAFATLPLFIISLGLLGVSYWLTGSIVIGVISTAALFYMPPIKSTLGYAYIDNGLALFCWGCTVALAIWTQVPRGRVANTWIIIAAILAGGAIGSKYFGLVMAAIVGCYLLLICKDIKSAFLFGVISLVIGSSWYLRSFIISGDPIHPVGGNIFGYYLWDATDLLNQKGEQATFGVDPKGLNIVAALDKVGLSFWMLAVLSLFVRNVPSSVRAFQIVFIGYLMFWFFASQVDRYLAPIYAVGTLLSCYLLYAIYPLSILKSFVEKGHYRLNTALLTFSIASILALLSWQQLQSARLGLNTWHVSLEYKPGFMLFSRANQLIPQYGDRMIHLGFENLVYFYQGTAIGDWFGVGRYRDMVTCENNMCGVVSSAKLKEIMNGFSAKTFIISTEMFPVFDAGKYVDNFDVIANDKSGYLLVLK